jgi:hypothetical protein
VKIIDLKLIAETINPLPPLLRARVYSILLRRIEEAKAAEKTEPEIEREIIETILQEVFLNLVEPIEMIEKILDAKALKETARFKIEFSEMAFDKNFMEKTQEFTSEFWSLVEELGFLKDVRVRKKQLNWKRGQTDDMV